MKVEEYRKKLLDLFTQLEKEHGNLSRVDIVNSFDQDEKGKYTIRRPRCTIIFGD